MRVLLVSDFYPPFGGGAELQIQQIGRGMVARGSEMHMATIWHEGLAEEEDDQGVQVHRIKGLTTRVPWFSKNAGRRFPPPLPEPGLTVGIRHLIAHHKPDIVHVQGWTAYSAAAALIGSSIPLLLSVRDYGYTCAIRTLTYHNRACEGPGWRKCLECASRSYGGPKAAVAVMGVNSGIPLLKRKIRAVHTNSTFTETVFRRDFWQGRPPSHVIENVIPSFREEKPAVAQDITPYLDKLPTQPFILYVGALSEAKGIYLLLEAYQRLENPPPLCLIGAVWADSPQTFPAGVTVLKDIPHAAVMGAFERSLFGVAPSLWPEPFGNVIHEGMSCGRAMIGTTPGGHADMIEHEKTGLLVQAGDLDALTTAMQQLINDKEMRERLGGAARYAAEQFSASVMLPRFERLYHSILDSQKGMQP